MTIQQCKYVLSVAEHGSFNEAAKQLFIAQSSLSGSIKQLENELGIIIFERSNHGVYLTEKGAEFVRYASQLTEQADFITHHITRCEKTQKLYISTQHYDFVADAFARLLNIELGSEGSFSLRETKTYDVIRDVENAFSDIGIIAVREDDRDLMERYLSNKNLSFTPFLQTYPHVFIRRDHPLAGKEIIASADLRDYPFVSYEQGVHNSSFFTEELTENFYANRHIEISDRATLMNVLLATDCYTIGTGIMPSKLNNGNIISVPLANRDLYSVGYMLRSDRKLSTLAKRFITILTKLSGEN